MPSLGLFVFFSVRAEGSSRSARLCPPLHPSFSRRSHFFSLHAPPAASAASLSPCHLTSRPPRPSPRPRPTVTQDVIRKDGGMLARASTAEKLQCLACTSASRKSGPGVTRSGVNVPESGGDLQGEGERGRRKKGRKEGKEGIEEGRMEERERERDACRTSRQSSWLCFFSNAKHTASKFVTKERCVIRWKFLLCSENMCPPPHPPPTPSQRRQ